MAQQYEEPQHRPSNSYHRKYEESSRYNRWKNLFPQNPTIGQRLALAIASLIFMLILSSIALVIFLNNAFVYEQVVASTVLCVVLFLCFLGTIGTNWIFNR